MNRFFLLFLLLLNFIVDIEVQAENSYETYIGKVYSIGDTITMGNNDEYVFEFENNGIRYINNDIEGKKLIISEFYDIKKLRSLYRVLLPMRMNKKGIVIAKDNNKSYLIDLDNAIYNGSIMFCHKKTFYDGAVELTQDILYAYRVKIYDIEITDDIVEQYLMLSITPEKYKELVSDPFTMSDLRKEYKNKLNKVINEIDFDKIFKLKCLTNVRQYDMDEKAFPIWKMEFINRDINKNSLLYRIGYCTFGEAAFTFNNYKDFLNLYCNPEKAKFLYKLARYNSNSLNDNTNFITYVYTKIVDKRIDINKIPGYKKPFGFSDDNLRNFCIDMNIVKVDGYYIKSINRINKKDVNDFYVGSIIGK